MGNRDTTPTRNTHWIRPRHHPIRRPDGRVDAAGAAVLAFLLGLGIDTVPTGVTVTAALAVVGGLSARAAATGGHRLAAAAITVGTGSATVTNLTVLAGRMLA